jgi:hypothetical protein
MNAIPFYVLVIFVKETFVVGGGCSEWFDPSCNLNNPNYDGDHPNYMCIECWEKGLSFRYQIQAIRDAAEISEQSLWDEWKEQRKKELE